MYLVISPKGGIGKTFISQNVIIPMLHSRYGNAVYVDYDINKDSRILEQERLIEVQRVEPDSFPPIDKNVVIDVGGNLTANNSLKFFSKLGIQGIATIVIPVGKEVSEVDKAIETYQEALDMGFNNFLFCINGVIRDAREEFILWYKGLHSIAGGQPIRDLVAEEHRREILIPYDTRGILSIVKATYRKLPYSYYLENQDFLGRQGEELKRAYEDGDKGKIREIMEKAFILNYLKDFFSGVEKLWKEEAKA